jgi:hypothetical protein
MCVSPHFIPFLLLINMSRLVHFGKMHPKIQGAVRRPRRRYAKSQSGRRKLRQRFLRVMRVPRLSLAATNEWLQARTLVLVSLILCAGLVLSIYYCPGFRLVFYCVFIPIVPLCRSQTVIRCCDVIAEARWPECLVKQMRLTMIVDYLLTLHRIFILMQHVDVVDVTPMYEACGIITVVATTERKCID